MASRRAHALLAQLSRPIAPAIKASRPQFHPTGPSLLPRLPLAAQHPQPLLLRAAHSIPRPRSHAAAATTTTDQSGPPAAPTSQSKHQHKPKQPRVAQQPHYELTFTCVPCGERSRHKVSKQGYHHGSVLITCPGCRNRHVMSDHLGVFSEAPSGTVEDLMRGRGRLVKRGTLGEDGDVEFWEDGTVTRRGGADDPDGEGEVVVVGGAGGQEKEEVDDLPPGATFKSAAAAAAAGEKSG
ncbi:zf-DNL-domain-containing protein [Phialemonium atrogriseum]|uniref:Zf-DNL-domain-containing protein n=1 Tax=Phialemonium atrogriseum TaxID=1093897 RepID=A0AAJ0FP87_9PEZI|nr:zf-DNL-domain-containing protein [Phialemonium atrogriseum]KAK1770008.1 zf-DNL-domain-containing protein [Phialemonium atrogriseum]